MTELCLWRTLSDEPREQFPKIIWKSLAKDRSPGSPEKADSIIEAPVYERENLIWLRFDRRFPAFEESE